jgi:tRNA nucleotidyltransferase (CCA-adding enzyme)
MTSWWPEDLDAMFKGVPELRQAFLVGGCVRDWLLGMPVKDFDVEVFGVEADALEAALGRSGRVDVVGRSFGVLKVTTLAGRTYDFALPRRDSKIGEGHRGFRVGMDPGMTLREAAARRDYTINAMSLDPRSGEVVDEHGGRRDLRERVLRHVSDAFAEDPLRVLRGMQFAGRFNLTGAPETVALCRQIQGAYGELAGERVWGEWMKWGTSSRVPSAGLRFLVAAEWGRHFPEVQGLIGVPQDSLWHPEGDVFEHTCHCLDALVGMEEWRGADEETRMVYSLAVLGHDFGKAQTTTRVMREGVERVVSPGHDKVSGEMTAVFLERIHAPGAVRERVVPLVVNHMAHLQPVTDRSVRRLAVRLQPETIGALGVVIKADSYGRPPLPRSAPAELGALLERAAMLQVQATVPPPILQGRHLLAVGMEPGPVLGRVLKAAREAQLDGHFVDLAGAMAWAAAEGELPIAAAMRVAMQRLGSGDGVGPV